MHAPTVTETTETFDGGSAPGLCVWFGGASSEEVRRVAVALASRLRRRGRWVIEVPEVLADAASVGGGAPVPTSDGILSAIRLLALNGAIVLVPMALRSAGIVPAEPEADHVHVAVEIPGPGRGARPPIPFIYRAVRDGRIEEQEVPGEPLAIPSIPTYSLEGAVASPPELAERLIAALEKDGRI
jgi:hypothetical protein